MTQSTQLWSIVLAAGEGTRLQGLTRDETGRVVPKQFYRIDGDTSMLRWTLDRVGTVVPGHRIVPIVADQHRRWWGSELAAVPQANIVVQPRNRGTVAGILLPLLNLTLRDPDATVLVTPSDHHMDDTRAFRRMVAQAEETIAEEPERIVLIGVPARRPDPELGWLVPVPRAPESRAPWESSYGSVRYDVAEFVEKPDIRLAARLQREGAFWNTGIVVARAQALLGLIRSALAEVHDRFLTAVEEGLFDDPNVVLDLYDEIGSFDFCRDVLEPSAGHLTLLTLPDESWVDLGTEGRIQEWRGRRAHRAGLGENARWRSGSVATVPSGAPRSVPLEPSRIAADRPHA
ncbi:MAG: NTP transferase domain-containing protein [Candidatus Eisenbacteria bacterium]|uniref:NTP transferase domain-containing protein n=1 Tax=Eiseniibacteriota bacterium TaxID=2212470 RepID=A0A956M0K1_UNCEI|nr:NTP transferase domain-containing protein [Candidatus Eisenbacteria bacterium]